MKGVKKPDLVSLLVDELFADMGDRRGFHTDDVLPEDLKVWKAKWRRIIRRHWTKEMRRRQK